MARPAEPFTIPPDALDKDRDFYSDLTPEEREEEGLPPVAAPEKEPPKETPAPEPEPEEEPEPEPEVEEDDGDDQISKMMESIASMREDLNAAIGKPEPSPRGNEDPLLAAARDHEDPVVSGMAERVDAAERELAALREERIAQARAAQRVADNEDFSSVLPSLTLDGKTPLNSEHRSQVESYILENPEIGKRLTILQLTRLVFPEATPFTPGATNGKGPGKKPVAPKDDGEVATIVDQGNPGAAVPQAWKPKPGADMHDAMKAAKQRFAW